MTAATSPPSSTTSAALNATLCPLCGQANQCAMEVEKATGQPQPPCWCTATDLSFSEALLARVPADARRKACICVRCAQASIESSNP